jgi:hypothetical protein
MKNISKRKSQDKSNLTGNIGIPKQELVNNPKHYCSHPSEVECIEIIEHMPFNIGAAMKYLWRAGLKDNNPSIQDYSKAIWYINREIQRLERYKEK